MKPATYDEMVAQRDAAIAGWNEAATARDQARAAVYKLRLFLSEFLEEYDSQYYDSEPSFWMLADKARTLLKDTLEMAALQRRWARLLKHKAKIYDITKGKPR